MNFITENKIPLGRWMESGVDWLTIHAATFFDTVSYLLETIILSLVDVFKWMPPAVPILVTAAIAWYLHRQISLVVFVIAALLLILNLGYWQEMLETFVLVFAATTISVLIGVPLG
ncbi:choline ABC transporter permease subunit, partial [Vibrio anguillarum]|nr:choline ABC transporter permease subunit [Vibrio anguillarum]